MDSSKAAVVRKRKFSGPSSWPRTFKASTGVKHDAPRASLPGRLTERQQLALALEESRKESLPQPPEQEPEQSVQPSESGDQSSSLRCCEDEVTTQPRGNSSRQLSKQQHLGSRDSCQPCSPGRANSHEQASTSGRVGAVASGGAKGGTFLSSSMSSGTSKHSASTAFKAPFSRSYSRPAALDGAFCKPLSLPDALSEPCPSHPSSPVSPTDRQPAHGSSSSASDLTAAVLLHPTEDLVLRQQEGAAGAGPAESTIVFNRQLAAGSSERIGSMTPSISHSTSPSNCSEVLRPSKKLRTELLVRPFEKAGKAAHLDAQPAASIKIRVKLGASASKPAAAASTGVSSRPQQPGFSSATGKRGAVQSVAAPGGQPCKRSKVDQKGAAVQAMSGLTATTFRKPRSKTGKGKLAAGTKQPAARPCIPASVFEEAEGDQTPSGQPHQSQPATCLFKACSHLASLDRRAHGGALSLLPRCSAFLELKEADEQEESLSDVEPEVSTDSGQLLPPVPPLASFEDSCCDIPLAAKLARLRLEDVANSQPLFSLPSLSDQPSALSGKLSKACRASADASASHLAGLSNAASCCSLLYQPLKAAAADWIFEDRAFKMPQSAATTRSRLGANAADSECLSREHSCSILTAFEGWIQLK